MILLLLACENGPIDLHGKDDTATTDADVDTDTDADTDTDVDPFCDDALSTDAPAGPDCVTETIACGDEIEATTEGGSEQFVGDDYTHFFCFVNVYNRAYDAAERVYALDLPAGTTATITADAVCDDVDLAVMFWADEDRCPTYDDGLSNCEGDDRDGSDDAVVSWDVDSRWLIVVEPKYGEPTNFRLRVDCG
jgi:hypothetical protein